MRGHRGTRQGLDFPDHETSTETDRREGSPEISEVNGQNEQLQDGFDPAAAPSRCQLLTHTRGWGGALRRGRWSDWEAAPPCQRAESSGRERAFCFVVFYVNGCDWTFFSPIAC